MSTMETTSTTTAVPTRWVLDEDGTSVEFSVKTFWGLMTVHGRFERFSGSYEVGPDGTSIALTIDAASVDSGNRTRDQHLRSDAFFAVAEHPQVRFRTTDVHPVGDGVLRVAGTLDAAGTLVPLEFEATVDGSDGRLEVEATTTVDQGRFGMHGGLLGMIRPPARLHVKARLSRTPQGGERP
jgi:polyisoprenoid-binding protein YceI